MPFAGTLVIVGYGMWTGYTYSLDFPGAQGRYLFGSLPSLAAAVALGLAVVAGPARRLLPLLAALLALGLQAAGVRSVLARSWLPPFDGRSRAARYGEALDGIVRWAPWPPAVTVTLLVLAALAAVVALAAAAAWALARDEAAPVTAPAVPGRAPEPTTV